MSDSWRHDRDDLLRGGYRHRRSQELIASRDKMQPSLLDRLTDDQPQKRLEPVNSNLLSHSALRRQVLRDLQWLFNTINNESQLDMRGADRVQRSVCNFGVAPLAGKRMS